MLKDFRIEFYLNFICKECVDKTFDYYSLMVLDSLYKDSFCVNCKHNDFGIGELLFRPISRTSLSINNLLINRKMFKICEFNTKKIKRIISNSEKVCFNCCNKMDRRDCERDQKKKQRQIRQKQE
jgi:hypothetical protein